MSIKSSKLQPWKLVDSEYLVENKWMKVRRDVCELPDGSTIDDYYVTELPSAVAVVPLTSDGKILLNIEYRHGLQEIIYQVPVGAIDPGEQAIVAAQRELQEETGYSSEQLEQISVMSAAPGNTNRTVTVFVAQDIQKTGGKVEHDAREVIQNVLVPLEQAVEMIRTGELHDMWGVATILMAKDWLQQNKNSK